MPAVSSRDLIEETLRSGKPMVGEIVYAPLLNKHAVEVLVPYSRKGKPELVGLNNLSFAAERTSGLHVLFHGFANTMRHEPSGLVGDAERAVQLVRREALLR